MPSDSMFVSRATVAVLNSRVAQESSPRRAPCLPPSMEGCTNKQQQLLSVQVAHPKGTPLGCSQELALTSTSLELELFPCSASHTAIVDAKECPSGTAAALSSLVAQESSPRRAPIGPQGRASPTSSAVSCPCLGISSCCHLPPSTRE